MKIDQQIRKLDEYIRRLLISGHNYSILIDIERSQITYLKYVANNDIKKANFKREYEDEKKAHPGKADLG